MCNKGKRLCTETFVACRALESSKCGFAHLLRLSLTSACFACERICTRDVLSRRQSNSAATPQSPLLPARAQRADYVEAGLVCCPLERKTRALQCQTFSAKQQMVLLLHAGERTSVVCKTRLQVSITKAVSPHAQGSQVVHHDKFWIALVSSRYLPTCTREMRALRTTSATCIRQARTSPPHVHGMVASAGHGGA
jgi:hypothetical protein